MFTIFALLYRAHVFVFAVRRHFHVRYVKYSNNLYYQPNVNILLIFGEFPVNDIKILQNPIPQLDLSQVKLLTWCINAGLNLPHWII
jgi:hypothetical protein